MSEEVKTLGKEDCNLSCLPIMCYAGSKPIPNDSKRPTPLEKQEVEQEVKDIKFLGDIRHQMELVSVSNPTYVSHDQEYADTVSKERGNKATLVEVMEGIKAFNSKWQDSIARQYGKSPNGNNVPPLSSDPVNHPSHYASGAIECIDAIEVATEGLEGFEGMCTGNAIKYLWRWKKKAKQIEDLKKAIWYIQRLINKLERSKEGGVQAV